MSDICVDFQDGAVQQAALRAILGFPNWRDLIEAYLKSLGFEDCCSYVCETTSTSSTSTSSTSSSSTTQP